MTAMTDHEERGLRDAMVLMANALGMDEGEAFRAPMRFAVRASLAILGMRQRLGEYPLPPKEAA